MNKHFRQLFCRHVFCGPDLSSRNKEGLVTWPCSKCGKVYTFSYGLQAMDYGQIRGPWGTRKQEKCAKEFIND